MKPSIYNSCIPLHNGYVLVYNATTDAYAICNDAAISTDGHRIISCDEAVERKLVEIGAFVDDDADEVADLDAFIARNDNHASVFHLPINPTLNCNFRCWYCYENHQAGSMMGEEVLGSVLNLITRVVKRPGLKRLSLSFFGGEPLMYFDKVAGPITKHAAAECRACGVKLHVHFTSNAYLLTPHILDSLAGINASFQITLDGARELHDKVRCTASGAGSYDAIVANIHSALLAGFPVVARINYTSANIDSVLSIVDDFKHWGEEKELLSVDLQRVWQDKEGGPSEDSTQEAVARTMERFRRAGLRCTSPAMLNSVKSPCYGDRRHNLLVNYDGNLFFCTARDFSAENSSGRLLPDGTPRWHDSEVLERRMKAKFSRPACRRCRIAPICGGGCRQKAVERPVTDACMHGYSAADIDTLIIRRFEQRHVL
ncbi:MAG: radical SAM protein [Muribaculaceae bacterium]|nr:radical SAM protein [Muribaculaceae bacterium]